MGLDVLLAWDCVCAIAWLDQENFNDWTCFKLSWVNLITVLFLESWRQYHWCLSTSFKIKTNLYNCPRYIKLFLSSLSVSEHYPCLCFPFQREVGQSCWQHHSCIQCIPRTALSFLVTHPTCEKVSEWFHWNQWLPSIQMFLWFRTSAKANIMNGTKTTMSRWSRVPRSCCTQALLTPLFWQLSLSFPFCLPFTVLLVCCGWFS